MSLAGADSWTGSWKGKILVPQLQYIYRSKLSFNTRRSYRRKIDKNMKIHNIITWMTLYVLIKHWIIAIFFIRMFFTFSSYTEYVKREGIVIAWEKKKFSPFDECSWFVCLRRQNKPKTILSLFTYSVCDEKVKIFVCLSVWLYVRTWTFHADAITFKGVSGSKQNLVSVLHV